MIKYYIGVAKNGFKFYCFASNEDEAKVKQDNLILLYPEVKRI